MVQAQLIKYGIILLVVLGVIGGVWVKIATLNSKLYRCAADVHELTGRLNAANMMLEQATQSRDALAASVTKSNAQRAAIQTQLNASLTKLRQQKPPSECKAAVDWAVENRGDLAWPSK